MYQIISLHVANADWWKNVASDVVPGRVLTSKSGTLAYLAPEVYAGKGYDVRADWWSLGVLFYECIYNKVCRYLNALLDKTDRLTYAAPF